MAYIPERREAAACVSTLVQHHAATERGVKEKNFICLFAYSSLLSSLLFLSAILAVAPSYAAPIISVDVDPTMPGIQSSIDVFEGAVFDAWVMISGVEAVAPLNAFEIALSYGGTVLGAQSAVDGGFLLAPSLVLSSDLAAPDVNFAVTTLLPTGAVGDGVLAAVTFEALMAGTALLELTQVDLSAPFGVPIAVGAIADAGVNVQQAPVPGTIVLMLAGVAALSSFRQHARRFGSCG